MTSFYMSSLQHAADSFRTRHESDVHFQRFKSDSAIGKSEPLPVLQLCAMPSVHELGATKAVPGERELFYTQVSGSPAVAVELVNHTSCSKTTGAQGSGKGLLGCTLATHGFLMSSPTTYTVRHPFG